MSRSRLSEGLAQEVWHFLLLEHPKRVAALPKDGTWRVVSVDRHGSWSVRLESSTGWETVWAVESADPLYVELLDRAARESAGEPVSTFIRDELRSVRGSPDIGPPLRCTVANNKLTIEISLGVLAFASVRAPFLVKDGRGGEERGVIITNPGGWAMDIRRALTDEAEDGSSLLTNLFDEAARIAWEEGSEYIHDDLDPGNEEDDIEPTCPF